MSIKSGQRYRFTNEENGLVFDLADRRFKLTNEDNGLIPDGGQSGAKKSVLGYGFHGLDNQQWITEKQDDGQWAIRSVRSQEYLRFENTPKDGAHIVVLNEPQFWDIEILSESEDHDNPRVRLWVRGTLLVVEFPKGRSTIGPLQLWGVRDGNSKNQVWVLEEYESRFREDSITLGQRYKITNEKTKLVLDLSGSNNKSILGWVFHGGTNQQWVLEKRGDGQWTIRSVWTQKYLGFESTPDNGRRLVGLDQPQLWDIVTIPGNKDLNKPSVKLSVRGTSFVADFPPGDQTVGADLQLWNDREGRNQVWVLEQYSRIVMG